MGPHSRPGLFLPEQSVTGSSWLSEKLELGSGGVNLESEGHVSLSPSLTRPPRPQARSMLDRNPPREVMIGPLVLELKPLMLKALHEARCCPEDETKVLNAH